MAIKRNLSELPPPSTDPGRKPDTNPRYGPALAQAWFDSLDKTTRAKAAETRIRNSDAGKCSRQIQYKVIGAAETEERDVASYWPMWLGTVVHECFQDAIEVVFPGAEREVKITYAELDSSGHADLWLPETKTLVELKTINGYGYKNSVGARGVPGPRPSHVLQAALNGMGLGADEIVIVYLAMENLSPREAKKLGSPNPFARFTCEFTYGREDYEPLALAEAARFSRILACTDRDLLVPRHEPEMPRLSSVVDPTSGNWTLIEKGMVVQAGQTWQCGYCPFQSRCILDGADGPLTPA